MFRAPRCGIRIGLMAAALCLGGTFPVFGQDTQPTEFQSYRLPGWTITPGVVIGSLFDSNVAIAPPAAGAASTASDTLIDVQPYGQVEYYSARTSFSSGYQGYVRRYLQLSDLDGTDHRAYVQFRERLTRRINLFANDNFMQVPTTDELQLNGVPFQRTGSRYNSFIGGVEARVTPTVDLTAHYEMQWVDFVRKVNTLLNGGIVNGLHTDLTRRLSDRFSLGGEYTFRWATLDAATRNLTFNEVGSVVRYRTGERTTVEVAGGLAHMADAGNNITKSGPYVRADVTQRQERFTITAGYERSYVPSFTFGGTNQSEDLHGTVYMPLRANRFYLEESASWRRTNPFLAAELPLDSIWINTVVGYSVQRWFRIEGYHAYARQDTRQFGGLINRNVAGVQFVVAEPVRIQ